MKKVIGKRLSLLLAVAMLVALIVPFSVTTVSAADPTLITDSAGILAMSTTGSYKLANDITISGDWENSVFFKGTLDGDGHTITYAAGSTIHGGLFKQILEGATIKNLYIAEEGTVQWTTAAGISGNGTACFGGLVGSIQGSNYSDTSFVQNATNRVTIQNVNVCVNLYTNSGTTSSAQVAIGGIVGDVGLITRIENCTFSGSITDSTNRTGEDWSYRMSGYGGMIGVIVRNCGPVEMIQCVNNGNITGYGNEGGILGYSRVWGGPVGAQSVIIEKCVNYGDITCSHTAATATVGGIAGYLRVKSGATATLQYNTNFGTISKASGSAQSAGIVGVLYRDSANSVNLKGNLQENGTNPGSQVVATQSGSGSTVFANNYSITGGTGSSVYTLLGTADGATSYASALSTLNSAYSGIYCMYAGKISLAWERSGAGTVSGGTSINDQADLATISSTGSYTLANDITITGTWVNDVIFKGTLNGNGHTITFANGTTVIGGLFRQLQEGATVKNLKIVQAGNTAWMAGGSLSGIGGTCIGGLTASIQGSTYGTDSFIQNASNKVTIQNVQVTANIKSIGSTSSNLAIGGIVGDLGLISKFENCTFSGSIIDNTNRSGVDMERKLSGYGGIVGVAVRNCGPIEITKCINNATISGYGNQGGMLGYSRAWGGGSTGPIRVIIDQCINNGTIYCKEAGTSGSVGGMAGYFYATSSKPVTIQYCINSPTASIGKVAGSNARAGGFIGGVRRDSNTIFLTGNLQESDSITGNQLSETPDGSGDLVYTNNYCRGDGNSQYSPLTYTKNYADAWKVLNTAYPGVFVFRNNKVTLKWNDTLNTTSTITSVKGVQTSGISNNKRSIRFVAGITNDLSVTDVGMEITIFYGNSGTYKTISGTTKRVHSSINANGTRQTAESLGSAYLYTAVIRNAPTSVGTITVLVRTFHVKGGNTYYSEYTYSSLNLAS